MAANFPSSPTIGDKYTVGEYQYVWNGSTWSLLPERINEIVNTVTTTANSAVVDLSKGNYHKISSPIDYSNLNITFTNIPSGSSKWFLELNTELGTRSWDISTATYDNISFSVSGQDTNPYGITFKPDGTKMYMVGLTNDRVYQYTLSTPWVVSSATYDTVSFLVSGQDTNPYGITFKPDGTKMYMVGNTNDRVYQYTLSTPWDLSTATYDSVSFLVSGQEPDPYQVAFKPDGTKMYVLGSTNNRIYQYTLSIPWDISTASYDDINFSTASQDIQPYGLDFKSDGTKMYIMGLNSDRVYQYSIASTTPIIIWPTNISWENGSTAPAAPDRGSDFVYYFHTSDGGTTYYGKLIKKDLL